MLARSIRQGAVAPYRQYSAHEFTKFLQLIGLLLLIGEGLIFTNLGLGDQVAFRYTFALQHEGGE